MRRNLLLMVWYH